MPPCTVFSCSRTKTDSFSCWLQSPLISEFLLFVFHIYRAARASPPCAFCGKAQPCHSLLNSTRNAITTCTYAQSNDTWETLKLKGFCARLSQPLLVLATAGCWETSHCLQLANPIGVGMVLVVVVLLLLWIGSWLSWLSRTWEHNRYMGIDYRSATSPTRTTHPGEISAWTTKVMRSLLQISGITTINRWSIVNDSTPLNGWLHRRVSP